MSPQGDLEFVEVVGPELTGIDDALKPIQDKLNSQVVSPTPMKHIVNPFGPNSPEPPVAMPTLTRHAGVKKNRTVNGKATLKKPELPETSLQSLDLDYLFCEDEDSIALNQDLNQDLNSYFSEEVPGDASFSNFWEDSHIQYDFGTTAQADTSNMHQQNGAQPEFNSDAQEGHGTASENGVAQTAYGCPSQVVNNNVQWQGVTEIGLNTPQNGNHVPQQHSDAQSGTMSTTQRKKSIHQQQSTMLSGSSSLAQAELSSISGMAPNQAPQHLQLQNQILKAPQLAQQLAGNVTQYEALVSPQRKAHRETAFHAAVSQLRHRAEHQMNAVMGQYKQQVQYGIELLYKQMLFENQQDLHQYQLHIEAQQFLGPVQQLLPAQVQTQPHLQQWDQHQVQQPMAPLQQQYAIQPQSQSLQPVAQYQSPPTTLYPSPPGPLYPSPPGPLYQSPPGTQHQSPQEVGMQQAVHFNSAWAPTCDPTTPEKQQAAFQNHQMLATETHRQSQQGSVPTIPVKQHPTNPNYQMFTAQTNMPSQQYSAPITPVKQHATNQNHQMTAAQTPNQIRHSAHTTPENPQDVLSFDQLLAARKPKQSQPVPQRYRWGRGDFVSNRVGRKC